MNDKYLTVTQINKYIKYKMDNDSNLSVVYLQVGIIDYSSGSLSTINIQHRIIF